MSCIAYSDANYATDASNQKSHGQILNKAGVTWMSKKQSVTAQSLCEAELITSVAATNELKWFSQLVSVLNIPMSHPFTLKVDNITVIAANSQETTGSHLKHQVFHHETIS